MQMPQTPVSEGPRTGYSEFSIQTPTFDGDESLAVLIHELSSYFEDVVQAPHTFEQLRTASVGHILKPLTNSLSDKCHVGLFIASLSLEPYWIYDNGCYSVHPFQIFDIVKLEKADFTATDSILVLSQLFCQCLFLLIYFMIILSPGRMLKWHYSNIEHDDRGVWETRGTYFRGPYAFVVFIAP